MDLVIPLAAVAACRHLFAMKFPTARLIALAEFRVPPSSIPT
jgi:hypothetical protein